MAENIEKLEAGSKLEPHLAQNSKVKVDWDGGIGCGNKEIQISEKLCVLLLSRRVTNKMMTLVFLSSFASRIQAKFLGLFKKSTDIIIVSLVQTQQFAASTVNSFVLLSI